MMQREQDGKCVHEVNKPQGRTQFDRKGLSYKM